MDTAGRRDSVVRLLRRRNSLTTAELAEELGVSRRTVLRDIAALRDRGFRISGDGGRGGGVRLEADSIIVSSQLAAEEVVALVISVAVARTVPGIPFAAGAERVLAKIEGALPAERVWELRRFMSRILVGDPIPTGVAPEAGAVAPELLPAFERAFTMRRVLRFDYVDRKQQRTRRRVEPHGLLIRAPLWYIIAWDSDKDAARIFRMDRVRRPMVDADSIFSPRPIEAVMGVCPDARVGRAR